MCQFQKLLICKCTLSLHHWHPIDSCSSAVVGGLGLSLHCRTLVKTCLSSGLASFSTFRMFQCCENLPPKCLMVELKEFLYN